MIYCFSGTGNTRHVAEMLARRLGHEVHHFTASELCEPAETVLESSDKLIIWAFPTYSWGVPPVVRAIIRKAAFRFTGSNTVHIAVTTCGDDIGNMAKMFRRDIESRGAASGAVFSVQMPNTYVMMKGFDVDPDDVARRKIEAAQGRVDAIARAITAGKVSPSDDMTVRGAFPGVKTSIIYPWFVRHDMSPDGFRVDAAKCISCGKCVRACPMDNISFDTANHPQWGERCAFCTACYHICPVKAISWKKTTKNKGQSQYFDIAK